ncbi:MAG: 50S ribosomal protein L23 [Chlamydiae bacterium CG10_big_fil_rev_8_21_14_0_10_42_34]|nr:MAG: 50S ribosomal protein L23 [Chlamydiae bacterium CG10_big_fil_rev_8_21_14_0_10_42_34]
MNPYQVIKNRRVTEKGRVLENLVNATSNPSLKRCQSPKVVFDVDQKANKTEIRQAVEEIYKDNKVKVVKVNTISVGPKERRVRGFLGKAAAYKKAVVTFRPGDTIETGA